MVQVMERVLMSSETFRNLPETNLPRELIEGEYVMRNAPTLNHQRVAGEVYLFLRQHVANGEVFFAPVSVYLDERNFYQPDVMWVAENSLCQKVPEGLDGPPDLVVEVLSPSTAQNDRGVKFRTYEKHGVREYWLLEPELGFLEVWQWIDGHFRQFGVFGTDETFTSPILQQEASVGAFFK